MIRSRRGFTLLELLIVIAIIGILVTVGAASYSSAQTKARNSRRMQDMKAVQMALEQYYANNDSVYPTIVCDVGDTYLPNGLPDDPQPTKDYVYDCTDAATYCVCAEMENGSGANSDSACDFTAATKTHYCVSNLQ